MSGPDFLGIGVGRAGTTYLYQRLRAHPHVWLPPIKELHFFDRERYGWPAQDSRRLKQRVRLFLATIRRYQGTWKSKADMRFMLNYLRGDLDSISSYRRHFPDIEKGVLKGEITPDYCELDTARIAMIKREFPELKLLLTIRNPLQRFESQVRKYVEQAGDASALTIVGRWLDRPGFVKSFDYAGIITRWRSIFGRKSLHVAYFDQLERDPESFMGDTCRFLGVEPYCPPEGASTQRVNSSRTDFCRRLPDNLIGKFAEIVLPLCVELVQQEGDIPESWCRDLGTAVTKRSSI